MKTLINAGEALAHMPLQNDKKSLIGDAVPEVQPTYFDLAVSRLQAKVDEVIDSVWKSLDDKVMRKAFKSNFKFVNEGRGFFFRGSFL